MALARSAITVTGLKELGQMLATLDEKVIPKLVRQGLRAGAKSMLPAIASAAPKGKTGKLARSFTVAGGGRKKGVIAVNIQVGKKWFVGDLFYAGFQEFGWKAGKRSKDVKAFQDVVRRATKSNRRKINAVFVAPADSRREIPGKHFVQNASQAKAQSAVAVIVETIRANFNRAIEEAKKGS